MSDDELKCDDCGGPAPAKLPGAFIEGKPLIDGKWLCDPCWAKAYDAGPEPKARVIA